MTIPFSETPTVGLGQFIKEVRFQVPSHQRDYSWKEEYVKQFIDDITGALKRALAASRTTSPLSHGSYSRDTPAVF
jgi:uncharacterized protein with ParB-like and HNH nuclease domain